MKKLCPLILCTLFSLSAASIETVDYTQGLSVWFDTPNNLDGQAIWLRANGTGANPDKAWLSCNSWGIKFSQFPSCIYLC